MNNNENGAAPLQNALAALPTDVPQMTAQETYALYLQAAQKAGLQPVSAAVAAPAKKLIRWQRWALSAAAALLVVAAGGFGIIMQGGLGAKSAAPMAAPEIAMDATDEMMLFNTQSTAQEPAAYGATGGASSSDCTAREAEPEEGETAKDSGDVCEKETDSAPDDGKNATADAVTGALPAAIMVDGDIYLYNSTLRRHGVVPDSAIIGYIDSCTDTWPQADWQSNFACEPDTAVARINDDILLRVRGDWYFCTLQE